MNGGGLAEIRRRSDAGPPVGRTAQIVRMFLLVALPLLAVVAVLYTGYRHTSERFARDTLLVYETARLSRAAALAGQTFQFVATDLALSSRSSELARLLQSGATPRNRAFVAKEFADMAGEKRQYLRLRLIDAYGRETIRVDRNGGQSRIFAAGELPDDPDPDMIALLGALDLETIHVAPLRFAADRDAAEMMFVTPVRDAVGAKSGLLVIDYDAGVLLDLFTEILGEGVGQGYLLDIGGIGLAGEAEALTVDHPEVWSRIRAEESGWTAEGGDAFVFMTLRPVQAIGRGGISPVSDADLHAWKAVSFIPRDVILQNAGVDHPLAYGLLGLVVLAIGASGWLWAAARVERRLDAAEIRHQRDWLQTVIDAMPDAVCLKDGEGRWLIANRPMLGFYELDIDHVRGHTNDQLAAASSCCKEALDAATAADERAWRIGRTMRGEEVIPARDGGSRIVELARVPLADDEGVRRALVVVGRDVTERRRVEAAMARLSRQNQLILESAGEGILGTDAEGRITFVNRAGAAMLGHAPHDLIGGPLHQTVHCADDDGNPLTEDVCPLHLAITGGQVHAPDRDTFRRRDGTAFPVGYVVAPLHENGRVAGAVLVFRDISDRLRAATELERARREAERYLAISEALIVGLDRTGAVRTINPHGAEILGYAPDELLGRNWFETVIAAEDRQAVMAELDRITAGDRPLTRFENDIVTRGGERRTIRWNNVFETDEQGRVTGALSAGFDVTDIKRAEASLVESKRDLERSNAELEQFAYVASHDLREPLRMISSYLRLIERRYLDLLDDTGREFIGYAVDGAKRMDQLILDLLEYSRVGRRGQTVRPVDMDAVVARARAHLKPAIEDCGATVHLPLNLPSVMGVEGELGRLFQNLIGNAIKYRAPDRPPVVTIAVEEDGQFWRFSVQDNGIGIAPEHSDRIFMIFQRLHPHGAYEGTGIGLAVCKKIVDHHGGRIWVSSEPGRGSTFFFTLPRAVSSLVI